MSLPPHQQQPPAPSSVPVSEPSPAQPRPARSKNGCNACRRRKVRCNEQRPRCSHCERLNLDCTWHRPAPARSSSISHPSRSLVTSSPHGQHQSFASAPLPLDGYGCGFDFSGPLSMGIWDEAMLLSPSAWPADSMTAAQSIYPLQDPHQSTGPLLEVAPAVRSQSRHYRPGSDSTSPFSPESRSNGHAIEELLLNSFLQMLMPPILTPVEIGPRWSSTRAFFATMAAESPLVKSAIMAFAAMQMQRGGLGGDAAKVDWRMLYDQASAQLPSNSAKARTATKIDDVSNNVLRHTLAALFLLTYIDLLTETLPRAHANLREAYNLIQSSKAKNFSVPERRLISWLRLLDARAVSTAGGEGLFLADDTDETLFDASPTVFPGSEPETSDVEIEEILFDVLVRPGLVFFHKVHSVAGRITRIDPWHRSRGTVEDETEVMALAAQISKDLHTIYSQRPILMDHAVAGNLTEKHLAKNLARALTQGFRTYLCNYYASFLHLHRVAYVQYPKTQDVIDAITNIKRLCHLMAQSDESLPVNVLWPLFMCGCEEEDVEERKWILEAIRGLGIATNAKATADLLEEVQRRQDESQKRVDARLCSSQFFSSPDHFAIV